MSTLADSYASACFPARYSDAQAGLRFRVVDETEQDAPGVLVTTEIGDGLLAALFWHRLAVTSKTMQTWGVSIDEALATAVANIDAINVKTSSSGADGASIQLTSGNPWASSLIVAESRKERTEDGFLVAIPHGSIMATTPVTGVETVRGLEILMNLCNELYEIDGSGVSPFVWWWYDDSYRRVTDRAADGSIELTPPTNLNAYHLAGAIAHLSNPCAECGRS